MSTIPTLRPFKSLRGFIRDYYITQEQLTHSSTARKVLNRVPMTKQDNVITLKFDELTIPGIPLPPNRTLTLTLDNLTVNEYFKEWLTPNLFHVSQASKLMEQIPSIFQKVFVPSTGQLIIKYTNNDRFNLVEVDETLSTATLLQNGYIRIRMHRK